LLSALQDFAVDALLRRFLDSGGILMGASAGAMVLCERTWLPDRGRIADGLGLVPHALVLPHWSPDGLSRLASFGGAGTGINVLGLPEQSGVMVENTDSGTTFTAHGARGSTIVEANGPTHAVRVGDCLTLPARIGP
jgi:peptidase E